ncbi:MAG TPA: DUF4440 domain-containing protein [Bryobacteraceae bacterium]|nr:DUF4440 domain-containing protein [Bryobacteraceae bacterium]
MRKTAARALMSIAVVLSLVSAATFDGLTAKEKQNVRKVNAAYVGGWLKNDPNAVLETLWPDAVLIPWGNRPIQGVRAIRLFWWPAGGPRTTVTSFTFTTDEIGGSDRTAYARGTYEFDFKYETNGRTSARHNAGNYLNLFRRDAAGKWRISHRMWGDAGQ